MAPAFHLPRTSPRLLARLLLIVLFILFRASSPAQMAEILPSDPPSAGPAPQGSPSQSPAGAAALTAAEDCCPPLPTQPPGTPQSTQAQNPTPDSDSSGQNESNPPNVEKAPWPTKAELAQQQAASAATAGGAADDSFPDKPAWANAMGDLPGANPPEAPMTETEEEIVLGLQGMGPPQAQGSSAAGGGTGQSAPPSASSWSPGRATLFHAYSPANQNITDALNQQLSLQDSLDAMGLPPPTDGLCFKDWYNNLYRIGADLGPGAWMANNPRSADLSNPDPTSLSPLQKALADGDLTALNPHFVEVSESRLQSGDTFVIPATSKIHRFVPLSAPIKTEYSAAGHIGFVEWNAVAQEWTAVSTNVNNDPAWSKTPLTEITMPMRFFRWTGPTHPAQ